MEEESIDSNSILKDEKIEDEEIKRENQFVPVRWKPSEEGTLHATVIGGLDDQAIDPEELRPEDMEACLLVMSQSNHTIRAENHLLETYLANMDPLLIENMDSILDAATAAIHKAERTVQLGVMASVTTQPQASKGTESTPTTPRSSGQSHTGGSSGKVAAFTLSDKGPKIQPSQKMEIIQREVDCLRAAYDDDKAQIDKQVFTLQCKRDAYASRVNEQEAIRKVFDDCLVKDWVNKTTKSIPGEQIITFFENRLKSDAVLIKAIQTRRKNLRIQLDALTTKIKELGDEIKYVDYEKLEINDKAIRKKIDETTDKLIELKKNNSVYQKVSGKIREKMQEEIQQVGKTEKAVSSLDNKINGYLIDEMRSLNEMAKSNRVIDQMTDLERKYCAPPVMDIIKVQAELQNLRKLLKVTIRKSRLNKMIDINLRQKIMCENLLESDGEEIATPSVKASF